MPRVGPSSEPEAAPALTATTAAAQIPEGVPTGPTLPKGGANSSEGREENPARKYAVVLDVEYPKSYLLVTLARLTRRITVRSFGEDQQGANTAFTNGSKIDGHMLLEADVATGEVNTLQTHALMLGSSRQECLNEGKRWVAKEAFQRQVRTDDGGKRGTMEMETFGDDSESANSSKWGRSTPPF